MGLAGRFCSNVASTDPAGARSTSVVSRASGFADDTVLVVVSVDGGCICASIGDVGIGVRLADVMSSDSGLTLGVARVSVASIGFSVGVVDAFIVGCVDGFVGGSIHSAGFGSVGSTGFVFGFVGFVGSVDFTGSISGLNSAGFAGSVTTGVAATVDTVGTALSAETVSLTLSVVVLVSTVTVTTGIVSGKDTMAVVAVVDAITVAATGESVTTVGVVGGWSGSGVDIAGAV